MKGHDTYSLTLNGFGGRNEYFVFQFDYKKEGLWIKYLNSCSEPLKSDIDKIRILFDTVSSEYNEYGWLFEGDTLSNGLDNIDMYISSNNYNL